MTNENQKTSREATEQFFVENCIENKNTAGETTSSDSNNKSEESQTSTQNNAIMAKNKISPNASLVEAVKQFFGGSSIENNTTHQAAGRENSAEVINILIRYK